MRSVLASRPSMMARRTGGVSEEKPSSSDCQVFGAWLPCQGGNGGDANGLILIALPVSEQMLAAESGR